MRKSTNKLILDREESLGHEAEVLIAQIRERARNLYLTRQLHDTFKAANGATCCSVLSRKVKHDKNDHFLHCADLTAESAEVAARLILRKRPELLEQVNTNFLFKRQSKMGGALSRLIHFFVH